MKRTSAYFLISLVAMLVSPFTYGGQVVSDLLASYDCVETVACKVRTSIHDNTKAPPSLTRVHFQKGDRLHVHHIVPTKRRIISDGNHVYYQGVQPQQGYRKSVQELDASWLVQLRNVPASPMEYLLPLKHVEETILNEKHDLKATIGCALDSTYVVLQLDERGRLLRLSYFDTPKRINKSIEHRFSHFQELCPGAWLALTHETITYGTKGQTKRISRFSSVAVNRPVHDVLFEPDNFLPTATFVDKFTALEKEQ